MERKPAIYSPIRESKTEIEDIAERALKRLEEENYIVIGNFKACYTAVHLALETAIRYVAERKSESKLYQINFYDLFNIGVEYVSTEEGEKDGNYNPVFTIRPEVIEKMKAGTAINRGFGKNVDCLTKYITCKENSTDLEHIMNSSMKILEETRNIGTGNSDVLGTTCVVFFEELLNWMVKNVVATENILVNFMQLIDFGIDFENDETLPYGAPGQDMKLIIKNDDETEEE